MVDQSPRQSEQGDFQQLSRVFLEAADAICINDLSGSFVDVNRAAERRYGWRNEELVGNSWRILSAPDEASELDHLMAQCIQGEEVRSVEVTRVNKSGTTLPELLTLSLLTDNCGQPFGVVSISKDISRIKRIEHQLRETERRYRYFVEQTQEGFYRLDFEPPISINQSEDKLIRQMYERGFIVECNDIYAKMYGYKSANEMTDVRLLELHGGDAVPENIEAMKAFIRDGFQHLNVETTEYNKSGVPIHLSNSSVGIIEDGLYLSCWGTQRDISERKQAEQALRDREDRLNAILNGAGDAVITIDSDGIIHDVNVMTTTMFQYEEAELVGQDARLLMPFPRQDAGGFLAQCRGTGQGREVVGRRKDGATFSADLAVSELTNLQLFIIIIRDVSDRIELQRAVLEVAENEQRRIGSDLHDGTQQELASLRLMAQTLLDMLRKTTDIASDPPTPNPIQLAEKVAHGISRAQSEVQAISRGLIPIRLDAQGLMDALRELASRTDGIAGIGCSFKCETPVEVDNLTATHLYRIAQEGTANALKHASPSHILIALEPDHGQPQLQIADDGVGFDPTVAEGVGLKTMRYRASLIGASLSVSRAATGGTIVDCRVF